MNLFERLADVFAKPIAPSEAARQLGAVARRNQKQREREMTKLLRDFTSLDA